ncbi:choice-of-anchor D domain-containing protein [Verrucomicrobium sp. BvORR034]|uniref:choice-of-anchor D domain-containing protein n=1 Tax=Verrucomicrobium sp. BvORR034 TaxID=1396418 RepID=UPI000679AEEF|nr:choice-of-anchor D domain-containing protein [Verrucomicrobium sp. BvORR034]
MHLSTPSVFQRLSLFATVTIACAWCATMMAASGDLDPSFGSGLTIDQAPTTMAIQPDGKVVLAGKSFLVSGRVRHGLFRLNADGAPDITFQPETFPGAEVSSLAVQSDGKILAAGILSTSANETPRPTVTRYLPDGRLDTTFQAPILRGLWDSGNTRHVSILLCPDKKILVSEVEQYTFFSRAYLRRLNANGAFDTSFDRDYFFDGGSIKSLALQPNGKIIVAGSFESFYAGSTYGAGPNISRLNADGSLDTTFAPALEIHPYNEIQDVLVQPDGKLITVGVMRYESETSYVQLTRLLADGARDTSFTSLPVVGAPYYFLEAALQSDGKYVLALPGILPTDVSWPGNLLRFNSDGTRDNTFVGNTGQNVSALALHHDGKLVVAGEFPERVQRRLNEAGTRQLSIPLAGKVRWTRTGTSSAPSRVAFDFLNAQGSVTSTVFPSYGSSYWEWSGTIPAGNGAIQARATWAGHHDVQTIALGTPSPEIAVSQQDSNVADNASTVSFTDGAPGTATTRSFTIANTGPGTLTGINTSITGSQAGAFQVIAPPASALSSGEATTFIVRLQRTSVGNYSAALHIASNDADESSFDISLTGSATASTWNRTFTDPTSGAVQSEGFDATGNALGTIIVDLDANANTELVLVNNTSNSPAVGQFTGLPDRSIVDAAYSATHGSSPVKLQIRYDGGTGNDIVLVLLNPGQLDRDFVAPPDITVHAMAEQPDGKILIGGENDVSSSRRLLRMDAAGNVDSTFDIGTGPNVNGVYCVAVLDDGKILVGGAFDSFNGTSRSKLVRLLPNGAVDLTFHAPTITKPVNVLRALADGKILVGGANDLGVRRLLPNGGDDTTFLFNREGRPVTFTGEINTIGIAPDNSLVVAGRMYYAYPTGTPTLVMARPHAFRFTENGQLIGMIPLTADGKFLVGGLGMRPNGKMIAGGGGERSLMLWSADGALAERTHSGSAGMIPAALQADGKVLSARNGPAPYNWSGPETYPTPSGSRVRRLLVNGDEDASFDQGTGTGSQWVEHLCLLSSGNALAAGPFINYDGHPTQRMALFVTNTPTNHLHRTSQSSIRWKRGGGAPEADSVTFDVSDASGQTWTRLGQGSRAANGEWEITGATMPVAGLIRARARVVGGRYNGSSGLVEHVQAYDSSAPELAVEAPNGTDLQAESAFYNFGMAAQNTPVTRSFTLRNTIGGTLNVSAATTGGQQGDFVITTSPATTLTGVQSTVVTVRFIPVTLGTRTTTLQITSNDPDESPFLVELSGTGVTAQQGWRHQHFNTTNNTDDAADLADFDKDGLLNLMEFAFDLDPKSGNTTNGAAKLPEPVVEGEHLVIRFTPPAAGVAAGLTYGAQASATLEANSWTPVSNTGTGGVHEYKIPLAGELRFMKVTVNGGGN